MVETRWYRVAVRIWPELATMKPPGQTEGVVAVWQLLLHAPLAIVCLVWLVGVTSPQLLQTEWLTLLLLFVLRYLLAQLDFSRLLRSEEVEGRGAYGRFVGWSAVLLFGPTVLWLDWLLAGAVGYGRWRRQDLPLKWVLPRVLVDVVRDTLPVLLAVQLYTALDGEFPLAALTGAAGEAALWATVLQVVVLTLVMLLMLWLLDRIRPLTGLARVQQAFRFVLALVAFGIVPAPFAVFAAVVYAQNGLMAYLLLLAGFFALGGLGHLLARLARQQRQTAQQMGRLVAQGRDLLAAPIKEPNLPETLAEHVPRLLPNAWVEMRLLPDVVLYVQADDWEPLADTWWQQLRLPYLPVPAVAMAQAQGYGEDGVMVPITAVAADDQIVGGIYAVFPMGERPLAWVPTLEALAAQVAAILHKQDSFDAALEEQAAAFEREVYEQAYQAEVYAQALALEKISQELAAAGRIQASFLPRSLPDIPGWQLAVTLEPARETSGDFFDVIALGNGRWGLLVADVADKGIGPALFMALSRTMIRIYASDFVDDPAAVLAAANQRILADTDSDLFVTVFYAVLDTTRQTLTYCNAGHNPGLWWQQGNGRVPLPLTRTALPLGVLPDSEWACATIALTPGDVVVMYTDGITEAQDDAEDFFGQEALEAVVGKHLHRSADIIENQVIDAVYDFVGEAPQFDDMTLMVLVREPEN